MSAVSRPIHAPLSPFWRCDAERHVIVLIGRQLADRLPAQNRHDATQIVVLAPDPADRCSTGRGVLERRRRRQRRRCGWQPALRLPAAGVAVGGTGCSLSAARASLSAARASPLAAQACCRGRCRRGRRRHGRRRWRHGVAVGGSGVAVGGTGVTVGGTRVAVGGRCVGLCCRPDDTASAAAGRGRRDRRHRRSAARQVCS